MTVLLQWSQQFLLQRPQKLQKIGSEKFQAPDVMTNTGFVKSGHQRVTATPHQSSWKRTARSLVACVLRRSHVRIEVEHVVIGGLSALIALTVRLWLSTVRRHAISVKQGQQTRQVELIEQLFSILKPGVSLLYGTAEFLYFFIVYIYTLQILVKMTLGRQPAFGGHSWCFI